MLLQLLSTFPGVFDSILDLLNLESLVNLHATSLALSRYVQPLDIFKNRLTFVMSKYHQFFKNYWPDDSCRKVKNVTLIDRIKNESQDKYLHAFFDIYLKYWPIEEFEHSLTEILHINYEPWSFVSVTFNQ